MCCAVGVLAAASMACFAHSGKFEVNLLASFQNTAAPGIIMRAAGSPTDHLSQR
jgi:hypothetical protein